MPYPRKNLNADETVALDMHPHWWYFWKPALTLIGILVVAVIVLVKTDSDDGFGKFLRWVVLLGVIAGAAWLVSRYMKWVSTNFVITSNRIIFRQGIVSKSGIEIPLDRVMNVNFHQRIFERLLGAGDLLIESGGEDGQSRFTDIRHPDRVQNLIHSEMEAHAKRRAGYSTAPATSTDPGFAPPPPPTADVAGQLEKLEGMLQRGTLTPEEFQAQKRRLLGT